MGRRIAIDSGLQLEHHEDWGSRESEHYFRILGPGGVSVLIPNEAGIALCEKLLKPEELLYYLDEHKNVRGMPRFMVNPFDNSGRYYSDPVTAHQEAHKLLSAQLQSLEQTHARVINDIKWRLASHATLESTLEDLD